MKSKYTLACALLLLSASITVYAQNRLTGTVRNAQSGKTLQGVTIYIPDLQTGATTDSSGAYSIDNIPAGNFLVKASMIGYGTWVETINIKRLVQKDYELKPSATDLKEVIITGVISATDKQKSPVIVSIMSNKELLENSSTNVIDAITKVPGVSAITDGQSISKPVIRGLGYNRVLTINDGVQQIDQAWFDEFGIEADPDAVNRVEILKGPASLAYGSDAIAGVVNLIPEEPLPEGQMKGDILFNYQTNNGLINNMAHLSGTKNGIAWSARICRLFRHENRHCRWYKGFRNGSDGEAGILSGPECRCPYI